MSKIITHKIIHPNVNPNRYFGIDFFASLFRGSHPSRKYYSSPSDIDHQYQPEPVSQKEDVAFLFHQEISVLKSNPIIGVTQNPDPYASYSQDRTLMRDIYHSLIQHQMGLYIETASDEIIKDMDLLIKLKNLAPLMVAVPISTIHDILLQKLEPNTEPQANQWKLIAKLRQEGIITGAIMKPMIPFINDTETDVKRYIDQAKAANCSFIYPTFGIHLDHEQRASFLDLIGKELPGLKNIYMDTYGLKNVWTSQSQKILKKAFVIDCKKAKIPFGMGEIIRLVRKSSNIQLKLF
jgi:DNA repair photolyase